MRAVGRGSFGEMVEHVAERAETERCGRCHIRRPRAPGLWLTDSPSMGCGRHVDRHEAANAKRRHLVREEKCVSPTSGAGPALDGLFSAHGMVLRARPTLVRPDFLPFFMQSDVFMDRAEQISVGSLSPTINCRTLKEQEFVVRAGAARRSGGGRRRSGARPIVDGMLLTCSITTRSGLRRSLVNRRPLRRAHHREIGECRVTWSLQPLQRRAKIVRLGSKTARLTWRVWRSV